LGGHYANRLEEGDALEGLHARLEALGRVQGQHRAALLNDDLAAIYRVPTKRLNEQVKRNKERFPADSVFKLTSEEARGGDSARSQIATLNKGQNIKHLPYAFTEHGALMAANVLRSPISKSRSGVPPLLH
jgi:hypothetical protein